ILTYERACGADTTSIGHSDYSYKQVKLIINFEMNEYYTTSMMTTVPFFYGAQPNMGLYFQPEGPCPNPAELMPAGKIREAQDAQEQAYEYLKKDLVFVGKKLPSVGCEGINFSKSVAWNLARTLTFVKEAVLVANIPVHVNVGMGVGGVPMMESPPVDSVTRVSKALVQIGKIDGL
ncbi:MAG: hypothetical protein FVQ80_18315, partial [Planctomycetes bacterium]|nr:hypothetical protein [Planctomycetota bacterium]